MIIIECKNIKNGKLFRQSVVKVDGKEIAKNNNNRSGQLREDYNPQYFNPNLDKLHLSEIKQTVPSKHCIHTAIGFNMEVVQYKNLQFQVWDLGGHNSIR